MDKNDDRFRNLTFNDFKNMAKNGSLSAYEKIGFPNSYREDKEGCILKDITQKLNNLRKPNQIVLDIGTGCSGLAYNLIDWCREKSNTLILVDSYEMLDILPDEPFIMKIPGYYPDETKYLFQKYEGQIDAILVYSVLQYVFTEGNLYSFLDKSLSLLSDGGEMLIGDIPNVSKRKRFLNSPNGVTFHQKFMNTTELPEVKYNIIEQTQIDDAIIFSIIQRARNAGFDGYILPQDATLPMANRREDILIIKP